MKRTILISSLTLRGKPWMKWREKRFAKAEALIESNDELRIHLDVDELQSIYILLIATVDFSFAKEHCNKMAFHLQTLLKGLFIYFIYFIYSIYFIYLFILFIYFIYLFYLFIYLLFIYFIHLFIFIYLLFIYSSLSYVFFIISSLSYLFFIY